MKKRLAFIMLLCLGMMVVSAQRKMIVVNAETKVPVRDVQVYTPEGTDMRTFQSHQLPSSPFRTTLPPEVGNP